MAPAEDWPKLNAAPAFKSIRLLRRDFFSVKGEEMTTQPTISGAGGGSVAKNEWSDRVIIVTGAAGGVGGGIAAALLETGARAVLSDIDAEELAKTAESLDPSGERLGSYAADLGDEAQVNSLAEHALERFGSLHGWVNNAGTIELGPALETARDAVVRQLDTNVVALLQCCQAAVRAMAGAGGAIVNVASNAGKVGFPEMVAYNASKAAVINLTRNLAEEWAGRGINVNAVCPGSVRTAMLRRVAQYHAEKNHLETDEVLASFVSRQLGRAIEPVEVGRVVVFLLSDAAKIIRGQAINVDAGDTPY